MLIKRIDAKGNAVGHTPEEAKEVAITRALSSTNTKDAVYFVQKGSITVGSFTSSVNPTDQSWNAQASGTAQVGYACNNTDRFFTPKEYDFTVSYQSSKDDLGMPDLKVTACSFTPKDNNPSTLAGVVADPEPIKTKKTQAKTES